MRYLILLIPVIAFAEINTTGNLIVNPGFDNGTTGWTLSGDAVRINDCCPGGHDLEFGDYGSIEQSFDLIDTHITQPMLNNGITLNSSVEVQNGEGGVGSWAPNRGGADTFTIRLQVRDKDQNVLATTTQERTNVTGINGKNFIDSVTYTGTGSNIGNIFISGSDANAPANLGGPNIDNISVVMDYDPVVLSVQETAIIATAFEEIEEVLTTVSPEELFIYEEFIVEEFVPFEEPQIFTEMFSEILVEEVAIEEINTGVVNVFTLAVTEELTEISPITIIETFEEIPIIPIETFEEIPMEISYEETIEEIPTEIESIEEVVEVREESETIEETEVAVESGNTNESGNANNISETNARSGGESNEETTVSRREESATNTEANPNIGGTNDTNAEIQEVGTESIQVSVDNIRRQVENTVSSVDQQLIATQTLVAKVISNNDILDGYNLKNQSIFDNQVNIDGGNIDDYYQRNYNDARTIYVQAQNQYNDPAFSYQRKIEKAVEDRIRAEQHLRRFRGY